MNIIDRKEIKREITKHREHLYVVPQDLLYKIEALVQYLETNNIKLQAQVDVLKTVIKS